MSEAWIEFGKIAAVHLLAVVSPGPDFAVVLRQSMQHGRRTAIWTSIGIGTANLVHVTYSVLGIGLVIRGSQLWFTGLKYAGAAYLAWLGIRGLRSRPRDPAATPSTPTAAAPGRGAFITGFLTNALNPKATFFFLALFATLISTRTPKIIQCGYGVWMALLTMGWFSLVSMLFTREDVRRRFLLHRHWIDRALGVVFIAFAVSLAVANIRSQLPSH